MKRKGEQDIKDAIFKKATGYDIDEVVEEFVDEEGELILKKKKVTKKHIPPDIAAAKMAMELRSGIENLSDDELKAEQKALLEQIKKELQSGDKKD